MRRTCLMLALSLPFLACSRSKQEPAEALQEQGPKTGLVEMKPEAQKHVGLQVAPASLSQLTEYLQVTGTVQPVDTRVAEVRPLARGRLQQVLVKVGDRVKSGQTLARFDNIEAGELIAQYRAAQAELQRLRIQHAAAMKQAERNRRLGDIGAVPQKEVEWSHAEQEGLLESIKSQESLMGGIVSRLRRFGINESEVGNTSTAIDSPFSGVVIRVEAAPGEVIDTDKQLFSIADLSQVWVQAEVYEKDLGRIRVGETALISVDTYPGERFSGRVAYISDVLDPQTRTAKVRCEVPNRDMRLKLDMFATVALPTTFSREAITVPTGAIQQVEGKSVVFVRRTPVKFEARQVNVGKTVNGLTEITGGLAAGEPIVTDGAFHLKSIMLGKEFLEEE
ncbi:MAG: efflux RND transporter periplasmic adaptor subunit [Acidobacteria bacterium]|nr:efflux RND transporter periplasmic adaptor subunit [Acidobacteriota bacterium]